MFLNLQIHGGTKGPNLIGVFSFLQLKTLFNFFFCNTIIN